MPTPLRETALAAIAARLVAQIPAAVVERARRAPVDADRELLPRLILSGASWEADEGAEPGITHYTMGFVVTGYARAATDLALEQALSALHAATVAALAGWTPAVDGLGEAAEEGAEFQIYDAEESAKPAGEFTARFSMLCLAPLGSPYTA
jgi:hypothetical protein